MAHASSVVSRSDQEGIMWMRPCAICRALLQKLQLCDDVRCTCGWEWRSHQHSAIS